MFQKQEMHSDLQMTILMKLYIQIIYLTEEVQLVSKLSWHLLYYIW